MNEFYQKDIISIKDYTKEQLEKIFTSTDKIMQLTSLKDRRFVKGKLWDICFMSLVLEPVLALILQLRLLAVIL